MRQTEGKIALTTPDEAGLVALCQRMIQLQSYTGAEGNLA